MFKDEINPSQFESEDQQRQQPAGTQSQLQQQPLENTNHVGSAAKIPLFKIEEEEIGNVDNFQNSVKFENNFDDTTSKKTTKRYKGNMSGRNNVKSQVSNAEEAEFGVAAGEQNSQNKSQAGKSNEDGNKSQNSASSNRLQAMMKK